MSARWETIHPAISAKKGRPMTSVDACPPAFQPQDLSRFFVERANAGDVDGLVALYESQAVLALPDGGVAEGAEAIRAFYGELLASRPTFTAGRQRAALGNGDLALTSTRIPAGATTEVARRQADGTWLWVIDQPNVLGD
jgi:ketosteroid isomerase-like protein